MVISERLAIVGACFILIGMLSACGADREATAAAKCGMPVADQVLGKDDPAEVMPLQTGVEVVDLGEGRYRVTGIVQRTAAHRASSHARMMGAPFVCEVAPDASDKLRGLKVTKLNVGRLHRLG